MDRPFTQKPAFLPLWVLPETDHADSVSANLPDLISSVRVWIERCQLERVRFLDVIYAVTSGFLTGLALIVAIGAQNAFVLRQGLSGTHVFWLCLFCSLSDAILIAIGVSGFQILSVMSPWIGRYLALAGVAFLFAYGILRLHAALVGDRSFAMGAEIRSLRGTLALAAVFTWANPHVYLDTVALIGAVSTGFPGLSRWAFALGAMLASTMFFFTLGYGARYLAPLMGSAMPWRLLDLTIGLTMFALGYMLILQV